MLRGACLAAWRAHARLDQTELAARLSYSNKTVAHWESGRGTQRRASLRNATAAARVLGAGPALPGLWQAAGAPTAIPARSEWRHNLPEAGHPAWAWLRLRTPSEALAHLRWGAPFRGDVLLAPTTRGTLVTFPTSIPNPPLEVTLPAPGWVAFGHGLVPAGVAEQLGIELVDARSLHGPTPPDHEHPEPSFVHRLLAGGMHRGRDLRSLAQEFGLRWGLIEPHLGDMLPSRGVIALDGLDLEASARSVSTRLDGAGRLVTQTLLSAERLRLLREARGLSLDDVVDGVTALLPKHPLSKKQLRSIEAGSRLPQVHRLVSRLDWVYQAEGRVGVDVVESVATPLRAGEPVKVVFPPYWRGPVWLQANSPRPAATGKVLLQWGPWGRGQVVQSGTVLTTNKALRMPEPSWDEDGGRTGAHAGDVAEDKSAPLLVTLPNGWTLTTGTGAISTALDINHHWKPVSMGAAWRLLREAVAAVSSSLPDPPRSSALGGQLSD